MGEETMPGLVHKSSQLGNAAAALCLPSAAAIAPTSSNGIWSKHRDEISFDQLQKFWNDLSPQSRRDLLKIDKQMLFEQARKNLYCSRCNGLLLEGFSQLVMYGKSLQQEGGGIKPRNRKEGENVYSCDESDDLQDPSAHPWGGLVGTRDGMLTLLDTFIHGKSLRPLQNVFDSARSRERERELLYPDACGGGGRGWISQGIAIYGRGHGTRETCALHTARLSCDTLIDFWSALGDDTRFSLLRMKEEDFIERLMYRFDSKRFCRDCRRNVIREFKELKELKRMRKEPRCTSWFCVADTSFQYEVTEGSIEVDWHESFKESHGIYDHFEWALGTAEGKSDILDFEDVGMNANVQVNGLDLSEVNACFITLRACRPDGRCTEVTVKAHGLKGQTCVHRRLVVGDGYVTITKGDSIRQFFEHAEEVEEEEDDDSVDKDGSDLDGDGSRPQKHAKSPELAREFLLDAATVIFKEQVEKAFREGTARQNAHSTFVCLALKLLEERVHVACKEIVTLEKQSKLLEEEEREKREEEERRERRRAKEREKKLRRKERMKVKEMERETKNSKSSTTMLSTLLTESSGSITEETAVTIDSDDSVGDQGGYTIMSPEESLKEDVDSFTVDQSKSSTSRKLRFKTSPGEKSPNGHPLTSSRYMSGKHRQFQVNGQKLNGREIGGSKFNARALHDRCDFHSCACKTPIKSEPSNSHRLIRYGHVSLDSTPRRSKVPQIKQVWEPAVKPRLDSKPNQTVDSIPMEEPNEETSSDPLTTSSSSDNCSSSLSEGGDSCTTSSEDPVTKSEEDPKSIGYPITGAYTPHVRFPVYPLAPVGAPWAPMVPVPHPHPHQFIFPPHRLGFGLAANPPADFYTPLPPPPHVLTPSSAKETPPKTPSFSLFHFGGPAAVPPDRPADADRSSTEAEVEYSLFSSSNGVGLSFLASMK